MKKLILATLLITLTGCSESLEDKATNGNAQAQYDLAMTFFEKEKAAKGENGDYTVARKWIELAAAQNHRDAQYMLGSFYVFGVAGPKDEKVAESLIKSAAEKGHLLAQRELGIHYDYEMNYKEATKWLLLAAEQNDAQAQSSLGFAYFRQGDYANAVRWFVTAANQGEARAQWGLGILYSKRNNSVENRKYYDLNEARKWLLLAADQKFEDAYFTLSETYAKDRNTLENKSEQEKWLLKAIAVNNKQAMVSLARIYEQKWTYEYLEKAKDLYQSACNQYYSYPCNQYDRLSTITYTNADYQQSLASLRRFELCNACADNVAQYMSQKPKSKCNILAQQALLNLPEAQRELEEFPEYCTW